MSTRQSQDERWTARPLGGTAPEDRAAARLRRLAEAPIPGDLALEKVRRRVAAELEHGRPRRAVPRRFVRTAAALLLLVAGMAAASLWARHRDNAKHDGPAGVRAVAPEGRRAEALPASHPGSLEVVPLPKTEGPGGEVIPSARQEELDGRTPSSSGAEATPVGGGQDSSRKSPSPHVLRRRRTSLFVPASPVAEMSGEPAGDGTPRERRVVAPATEAPPAPNEGADREAPSPRPTPAESALLGRALTSLRRQGNARGALALLDEYDRTYPRGGLRNEATLARIEAHLSMADGKGALRVLDRLALHTMPRAAEAQVLRGELRSDAGRWKDALADFEDVQSGALPAGLRERALYGQAVCLWRLGRQSDARTRAERYVATFPHGRFVAEMRGLVQP